MCVKNEFNVQKILFCLKISFDDRKYKIYNISVNYIQGGNI